MNKAQLIRFLQAERCSVSEIALAVGYTEWVVRLRITRPKVLAADRVPDAIKGWRGYPLSDKVMSL